MDRSAERCVNACAEHWVVHVEAHFLDSESVVAYPVTPWLQKTSKFRVQLVLRIIGRQRRLILEQLWLGQNPRFVEHRMY